jgi:imidazole glycerol-phosphate synthase subunit HisH
MIAIVDYGVGNLRSVERALLHADAEPVITADANQIAEAEGLVLPGVGAFEPAIRRLNESGLGELIVNAARIKPVLGVCLGYQLLFEESEEGGAHRGLGLLPGRVVELQTPRVPVIGWSRVRQSGAAPLWEGIDDGAYFYFVHSYAPESCAFAIGSADHSPAAAARRDNVVGTQFHPEKSGADGLRVYANFVAMCHD